MGLNLFVPRVKTKTCHQKTFDPKPTYAPPRKPSFGLYAHEIANLAVFAESERRPRVLGESRRDDTRRELGGSSREGFET